MRMYDASASEVGRYSLVVTAQVGYGQDLAARVGHRVFNTAITFP